MAELKKTVRLLLTGGGTGGHLFPAIAAAEELCSRLPGAEVLFVGTHRKMDTTSLSRYGYRVKSIHCYGLKGKSVPHLIKALLTLPLSFVEATLSVIRFRPDVVLGVGGYVTGPVIAAAKMLGKKTVIHEQNSIPGLANRKLGGFADRVCISLPQSASYFPEKKVIFTGNPVRKPILDLAAAEKKEDTEERKDTLLVLGGSQGAHRVNGLVTEALCSQEFSQPIRVIHQTGSADCGMVREKYARHGIECVVEPFFTDMAAIYSQADVLVSRAGATTLAELAVLGKPAVLIPYPHAADNHQHLNADYYAKHGGCIKFSEDTLSAVKLGAQLEELFTDIAKRNKMAERMRELAVPKAAANIVDVCMDCIKI